MLMLVVPLTLIIKCKLVVAVWLKVLSLVADAFHKVHCL